MSKRTLILLSIVGLLIIFLLCVLTHKKSIEQDIANCSQDILTNANFIHLNVDTKNRGREVLLTGFVESETAKIKVLKMLENQCHITGIEENIQVKIPKPTKLGHISIVFNNNNELVNFTGLTSKQTIETNFGFLLDSFKRAKKFKLSIVGNKDVIPVDYHKYTSILIPHLKQIDAANISFEGNKITLKGYVATETIKNRIEQDITQNLGQIANIVSLLTVKQSVDSVLTNESSQSNLDANHCQQELTTLLQQSKIHFDSGSSQISSDSFDLLNKLAKTVKSCQGVTIEIIGHTDKSGNENNNIKLSKSRAKAVANYLFQKGVASGKLKGKGVGSSQPIATNQTKQGRSQNRRLEFKVRSLEE